LPPPLVKEGNLELTREFLLERKAEFEKQMEALRENYARFAAVVEYTDELIKHLEKVEPEATDEAEG